MWASKHSAVVPHLIAEDRITGALEKQDLKDAHESATKECE